ncbi:MAG TPA: hypothetical protein DDY57_00015 [Franconibacter pulveris]|nr:hypothetical protein [Franconibacter pulveris]
MAQRQAGAALTHPTKYKAYFCFYRLITLTFLFNQSTMWFIRPQNRHGFFRADGPHRLFKNAGSTGPKWARPMDGPGKRR